jgi:hypothetical protein
MSLKTDFTADLRAVPEGISDFLTTPIPSPPTISQPATVDNAIIVQGVLSYYILELFRPFSGLTPVELLLRIGQHNSVVEAMLLAGLEYLTDSDAQNDFKFILPEAGKTYAAGVFAVTCQVTNGAAKRMTCVYNDGGEKRRDLPGDNGYFQGSISLMTPGEYTLAVTGDFTKKDSAEITSSTKNVTFTVTESTDEEPPPDEEPPQPPGGKDTVAVEKVTAGTIDELKKVAAAVAQELPEVAATGFETIKLNLQELDVILKSMAGTMPEAAKTAAETVYTEMKDAASAAATALTEGAEGAFDLAETAVGDVANGITKIKDLIGQYL